MKIICIDGNFTGKAKERDKPFIFLKPESSLLRNKQPFFIPDHTRKVIPLVNPVLKICRVGTHIKEKFAHLYYNEIGLGIDMEAADVLARSKAAGAPWETAKAYNSSAPLGEFIPVSEIPDISDISFSLNKNGQCIAFANTAEMFFSFNKIIEHVSEYMILKTGDYIFCGSPSTVVNVEINDRIECYFGEKLMLGFNVK